MTPRLRLADPAYLGRLCEGLAQVDLLIEVALTALGNAPADPQRADVAEPLIEVRDWLRGQRVRLADARSAR